MGVRMTLRKLGKAVRDQIETEELIFDANSDLLKELRTLNDYMAVMNNEPSPPDRDEEKDL